MTKPVITFFNNKGGVGKTSLIYHLAWILAEQRIRVAAIDLDPQANLTAAFLDEDTLEAIWSEQAQANTIYRAIAPLTGMGDILNASVVRIAQDLYLLPGDVDLSSFEEQLASEWPASMRDKSLERPFRILTSFWHVMQQVAQRVEADVILVDIGPNLGAINRSVLIATDHVVIPLGADLFSLQGLQNLGPTLTSWRKLWKRRVENWEAPSFLLPAGTMKPAGYLCQQHSVRLSRPVRAYDKWINRIPAVYRESILQIPPEDMTPSTDPYCLGIIKHYRSLVPLAQDARKPIFKLTSADGAIGNHANAVREAYTDFVQLSHRVLEACGLSWLMKSL